MMWKTILGYLVIPTRVQKLVTERRYKKYNLLNINHGIQVTNKEVSKG